MRRCGERIARIRWSKFEAGVLVHELDRRVGSDGGMIDVMKSSGLSGSWRWSIAADDGAALSGDPDERYGSQTRSRCKPTN